MKKTIISIFGLIILTFFAGSAWGAYCAGGCASGQSCRSSSCDPSANGTCVTYCTIGSTAWDPVCGCDGETIRNSVCLRENTDYPGVCYEGCNSPITIPPAGTQIISGDTTFADNNAVPSCRTLSLSPDDLYVFTLDADTGTKVTASVTGFNTVLYIREVCDDADSELACDDDSGPGHGSLVSRILYPGEYFLIVDGYSYNSGSYELTVDFEIQVCNTDGDDICTDGDHSGFEGDNPCNGGNTISCDDNCPEKDNLLQEDTDNDTIGDDCDNCQYDPNTNQGDCDNNTIGDACEIDTDSDLIPDECDDCPYDAFNDADGDDICGDIDICPKDSNNDADNDTICGDVDNCPDTPNPGQEDFDNDTIGYLCDNCREKDNPDQEDFDNDSIGDLCDVCPYDADNDIDGDGICDACIIKWEGDGTGLAVTSETSRTQQATYEAHNLIHNYDDSPSWSSPCWEEISLVYVLNLYGVEVEQWNTCDGVWLYSFEKCPEYVGELPPDDYPEGCGGINVITEIGGTWDVICSDIDNCIDTDNDGYGDPGYPANTCPEDLCPTDSNKSDPGQCGCGEVETGDSDSDGTADCNDNCTDTDDDGYGDPGYPDNTCLDDLCPSDSNKFDPGQCGCGEVETDTDLDLTADCIDNCPIPNILQSDSDGDEIGDRCDDCPADPDNVCDPNGTVVKEISSGIGGEVETPDGNLIIYIEPGDLREDTTISVTQPTKNNEPVDLMINSKDHLGNAIATFFLEPDGLVLNNSVTVIFTADVTLLSNKKREKLNLYRLELSGSFEIVPGSSCSTNEDPKGTFVRNCTAELDHFSVYAMVAPLDTDNDTIFDLFEGEKDNCPDNCNRQQLDADEDGIGDVCDDPDDGCDGCGNGTICEVEC
jgi:hypothetical protein